jgi:carboxyl-terminal processing protease
MKLKSIRNLAVFGIVLVLFFGAGYWFGQNDVKVAWSNLPKINVVGKNPPKDRTVDMSQMWDVWNMLDRMFIDKDKVDAQKMVHGAISGMVAALGDPYTVFLPPVQNKESKEELSGSFEGIGAQLGVKDKRIIVVAPLSGMPAEAAGIKAGDWIIKVDGKETSGWSLPEAVSKIRGPKGTTVALNILHKDGVKPIDVEIVRNTIRVESVNWKAVESTASGSLKKAVYLRLSRFGDETTTEWDRSVSQINAYLATQSGSLGLVLDLRNNPGGYLKGAVYIASEFLSDGLVVTQANSDQTSQKYEVNKKGNLLKIPLVVLVNGGSASASEIVAGALQARKRAILVGEKTFGKGSVQEVVDLSGGAGLHVTVSKWLLPDGRWINGTGLEVDDKIEFDEKQPEKDLQLEKAIEILNKK